MRLPRIHADTTALRESRELRSLVLGNFISGLGTQASLVALPYQLYVQTKSPLLTGLLGAAELGPLVVMALVGGAVAGAADSVSAVCRNVINQGVTPDAMRGRMSSIFSLVVT